MQLITAGLRAFQLLFTIVVFGVSVSLARGQKFEGVPVLTGYSAAAGAIGILASIVGITAIFVDKLAGIITWTLDAVSGLVLLGGGVATAIYTRKADCGNWETLYDNYLFDGGRGPNYSNGSRRYGVESISGLKSRCVSYKADVAFMFLSFIMCAAVLGWTFTKGGGASHSRRGGSYV